MKKIIILRTKYSKKEFTFAKLPVVKKILIFSLGTNESLTYLKQLGKSKS